jgi:apolipoprotein N-acyltransferase
VRWAALVAVVAGALGAIAFPRLGIWPFAFVSVAGLSWAVDGRRARTGAWLGLLYGLAFFGPLLHWTGVYVGAVPWLLLATAEAGFMAGLGAILPTLQRLPWAPAWIAAAWVLQEALRDRLPFGGFPWGRLAFSQAESPLKWLIAFGGAPLLSCAVALTGGGLWYAARGVRSRADVAPRVIAPQVIGLGLALSLATVTAGALAQLPAGANRPHTSGSALRVALIQGSVPDRGLAFEDRAGQVLENHVAETMKLAQQVADGSAAQPDLVVWPENASDLDPRTNTQARALIQQAVDAIHAPVLVGAILSGPGKNQRQNAGILWSPTSGPGATYLKRHPVPFAEYMPLRSIADRVSSAAKLVTQDMIGGHGNGVLAGGPVLLGDVICFEVAYDDLVRSSVLAGAQLLIVQTNNATFGHTAETYQQLAMSQLRAIENGRTVLQVSTTGVSAVIDPNGDVTASSGALFQPAIVTSTIAARTGETIADDLGSIPEYLLASLAVVGFAWSARSARRRRTEPPSLSKVEELIKP